MSNENTEVKKAEKLGFTIQELEYDVFKAEGIRVVIRAPQGQRVPALYSKQFKRGFGDERMVELLINRLKKIVGREGPGLTVVFGTGGIVYSPDKTTLGAVRESYVCQPAVGN